MSRAEQSVLIEHFKECDCHDSWDQCPCADDGHPKDGSCDCCPLGTGLCGPKPEPTESMPADYLDALSRQPRGFA